MLIFGKRHKYQTYLSQFFSNIKSTALYSLFGFNIQQFIIIVNVIHLQQFRHLDSNVQRERNHYLQKFSKYLVVRESNVQRNNWILKYENAAVLTCKIIIKVQKVSKISFALAPVFVRKGTNLKEISKDDSHILHPMEPIKHSTSSIKTHHIISPFICFSKEDRLYLGPLLFNIAFVSCPI